MSAGFLVEGESYSGDTLGTVTEVVGLELLRGSPSGRTPFAPHSGECALHTQAKYMLCFCKECLHLLQHQQLQLHEFSCVCGSQ